MKFEISLWNLPESGLLKDRGKAALKDLQKDVQRLCKCSASDAFDKLEEFLDDYYNEDGDVFLDGLLYDYDEVVKAIKEYYGFSETRKLPRKNIRSESIRSLNSLCYGTGLKR